MKYAILIQVRHNSKRLPGKAMLRISGYETILHVYHQCKKSLLKNIIICTSKNKTDDSIARLCKKKKIKFFRGNLNNVYLRYIQTINKFKIKSFIRINGDSPLINYQIINKAFKIFKKQNYQIVTNVFPRSYPIGQSVEIISSDLLKKVYKKLNKNDKEHIFKYFYRNYKKFNIYNIKNKNNMSKTNLSINTLKDYEYLSKIIKFNEKI